MATATHVPVFRLFLSWAHVDKGLKDALLADLPRSSSPSKPLFDMDATAEETIAKLR